MQRTPPDAAAEGARTSEPIRPLEQNNTATSSSAPSVLAVGAYASFCSARVFPFTQTKAFIPITYHKVDTGGKQELQRLNAGANFVGAWMRLCMYQRHHNPLRQNVSHLHHDFYKFSLQFTVRIHDTIPVYIARPTRRRQETRRNADFRAYN